MRHPILRRLGGLLAGCVVGASGAGCSTDEVQLESMYVSLTPDDPEQIGGDQEIATCLTVIALAGEDASYEVRLNGRPLRIGGDSREVVRAGNVMFCVTAGDFNLSLVAGGRTVAQTGTISMRAGAQHVFLVRGKRQAPTIDVDEIDMSSPGPDLRRIRVSNFMEEKQPIEIFFYDGKNQQRGSTGVIAYGDTYEGSISTEIGTWRYPDYEFPLGVSAGTGGSRPSDSFCLEKPPAGLVLLGFPSTRGETTYLHHQDENYMQRPLKCTVDTTVCPQDDRCVFQGW